MGGKSKQAQRTKNNARPSSSGRSAELLCGGVGTGAGSALFPSLAAAALDAALPTELTLALKKLNKKDPITKTKALQELNELVQHNKVDDIVLMLPNWTHFYKTLSVDPDRKVRELTQVCHGSIVQACGRRVAPQLKAVLPCWLGALHDDYPPARSAAHRSLHSTFPAGKLPEAISFCREEVVTHLLDCLLHTDAAVTRKLEDEEERGAARERVVCSALQGVRFVAGGEGLPAPLAAWLWTRLEPLLRAPAFWKLANHRAPHLRAAWYGAVGALGSRFGEQFGSLYGARALRALLATKEEGAGAGAAWAALLQLATADTEWYSRLDKKELLVRRATETLAAGGWGDARALAGLLPAVLDRLPADALTQDFCAAIFDACFAGLEKRSVVSSGRERVSWLWLTGACAARAAARLPRDAPAAALRRAALAVQRREAPATLIRELAEVLSWLLRRWTRVDAGQELLVRSFWQSVASGARAQLAAEAGDLAALVQAHADTLLALHDSLLQKPKKRRGVKFADGNVEAHESQESAEAQAAQELPDEESSAEGLALHRHHLADAVQRVCADFMLHARGQGTGAVECVLSGLAPLLRRLGTRDVWAFLGRELGGAGAGPAHVWELLLLPWLQDPHTRCAAVVDTTFLLLPHLAPDESDVVFASFDQLGSPAAEWALSRCAAGGGGDAATRWLRGGGARAALLRLARAALAGDRDARDALLACLAPDNTDAAAGVLGAAGDALAGGRAAAPMAVELAVRFAAPAPPRQYEDLLVALFRLDLDTPMVDGCEESGDNVRGGWQSGLSALGAAARDRVTQRLADLLRLHLRTPSTEIEYERIERAAAVSAALVDVQAAGLPLLVERLLAPAAAARADVLPHAVRYDILADRLSCPLDDSELVRRAAAGGALARAPLVSFARECVLRATLLRALAAHAPADHPAPALLPALAELLHDCAVFTSLHRGYAFWSEYPLVEAVHARLSSLADDVVAASSPAARRAVLQVLTVRAQSEGFYWAHARAQRRQQLATGPDRGDDADDARDQVTGDGFFHMLQTTIEAGEPADERSLEASALVMSRALLAALEPGAAAPAPAPAPAGRAGLDIVIDACCRHPRTLLDSDVSAAPWSAAVCTAAVAAHAARLAGAAAGWAAPAHHWDFITLTLASLLDCVHRSQHAWGHTQVALVTRAALRLYLAVERFVSAVPAEAERRQPAPHVAALPREWRDVFEPQLTARILHLAAHVLEGVSSEGGAEMCVGRARVVSELCRCVERVRWECLTATAQAELPLARLARAAAAALAAPAHHGLKYLAAALLRTVCTPLVRQDEEIFRVWSEGASEEGEKAPPPLALDHLDEALRGLPALLAAALAHLRPAEDTCEMAPHSDTHRLALGWLLLVAALGDMWGRQRGELSLHYMELVRSRRYTQQLLPAALRLLPAAVAAYAAEPAGNQPAPKQFEPHFLAPPALTVDEPSLGSHVSLLACHALYVGVAGVGSSAARGWWGAASARESRALTRLVEAYVTPSVLQRQLRALDERGHELQGVEIHVHRSTGEVTCVVWVEEQRVELTVQLSRSHPLALPRVACPAVHAHSAAPNTHWLAVYLAYQNGSLLSALRMWSEAVGARVAAAPPCYICYCRLQPGSARLPSVQCHQCRNKFHPHCLRKWFTTSNKSNCPLCRTAF